MKTILKSCIIFWSYVLLFATCQNDMDFTNANINDDAITNSKDIIIADGFIKSPKWLAHIVDSIGQHYQPTPETGRLLYPFVFAVEYKNQEYLCVCDPFSSACNNHYYTLLGNFVDPHSSDWFDLDEAKERTLLWSPPWSSRDAHVSTRAWVGTVNITTPNNSSVSDTWNRTEELTSTDITTMLNDLKNQYPNATIVTGSSPTTTYNCHAYAWHITAPQYGSAVWMGKTTNPTNAYWLDDSYIATTSSSGNKVAYMSDNHSAVVVTGDNFISKWGPYPLMSHHKNYSPYNASQVNYYKRFNPPAYYIGGVSYEDYSGSSTVYANNGLASIRLYAYKAYNSTTPTSYTWSATWTGQCNSWYQYPGGNYADHNIYINSGQSGGTLRVECKIYYGGTLLYTAFYYLSVY